VNTDLAKKNRKKARVRKGQITEEMTVCYYRRADQPDKDRGGDETNLMKKSRKGRK